MKNVVLGLQWMLFIIAAAIAVPISISDLFMLDQQQTLILMQNTIFVLGIAGAIQGFFGHKMPISESPAGLWWSVLTIYSGYIGVSYATNVEILQVFSAGMMFSGILFIVFSVTGLIEKISKLFTSTVTFIYLVLLSLQLSGTFIKGITGVTLKSQEIDVVVAVLSVVVIVITFYLGSVKIPWVKQFSVIISIAIGWILFAIFGKADPVLATNKIINLPKPLGFGMPKADLGMGTTAFFITFLLIMNMLASINIMSNIVGRDEKDSAKDYRKTGLISGINQILGGGFNTVGTVPVSSSAGFVAQIGEKSIKPFILGCIFVSLVSLFPKFMNLMAALPTAIGYSVTFVLFSKMIAMALFELKKVIDEDSSYIIIGVSLLVGVGVLFLPPSAMKNIPSIISSFIGNGLIIGSLLGIVLEQIFSFRKKKNLKNISQN